MSEQQAQQQQEPLAEPITKGPEGGGLFPAPKKGFWGKVDEWFGITRSGSRYRTEIVAGVTTFMAMVYILMVNADMFKPVIEMSGSTNGYGAAYIATALGAIVGTLLMAFLARMPLAQASGMGINAFIVYTLILGGTGLTYANCMVFTLLDGVIFLILTTTGLRRKDLRGDPRGRAPRDPRRHRLVHRLYRHAAGGHHRQQRQHADDLYLLQYPRRYGISDV